MRNSALSRNRFFVLVAALVLAATVSLTLAQQSPAGKFDGFQATHVRKSVSVGPGESVRAVAKCPEGHVATGGGSRVSDDAPVMVEFDAATTDGRAWEARAEHIDEDDSESGTVIVTAVCAKGYFVPKSQLAKRRR